MYQTGQLYQAQPVNVVPLNFRFGWLFGRNHDLVYFYLPILVYLAAMSCLNSKILLLSAVGAFVYYEVFMPLGPFQTGATFIHYFDKRNQSRFFGSWKNIGLYIIAPIIIYALSVFSMVYLAGLFAFIYIIWTVQHLTQQNVGMLLLHRDGLGKDAAVSKTLEARTQQIPAVLFSCVFLERQFHFPQPIVSACFAATLCITVLACVVYLSKLYDEAKNGATINASATMFWFVSVWFFLPMGFFGDNLLTASLLPRLVHWTQYIGLNYLLVKRKYRAETNKKYFPSAHPVLVYFVLCTAMAIFVQSIDYYRYVPSTPLFWQTWLPGVVFGFSTVHYFQDALIWRFRHQYNREAILPFLKPANPF